MKAPADHRAIPPTRFRDQATGTANTRALSEAEGQVRARHVVECMPAQAKRAVAPAQGYPR